MRLDKYRHFIRFKLEANRLTGYVIAVEQPSTDFATAEGEARARAHLIDTIELECGAAPPPSASHPEPVAPCR